jgi:hypothetical protein
MSRIRFTRALVSTGMPTGMRWLALGLLVAVLFLTGCGGYGHGGGGGGGGGSTGKYTTTRGGY